METISSQEINPEEKFNQQFTAHLDSVLKYIHEAIYLIDEQGKFQYVNEEACELLGYSKDELLRMGPADIDPGFPEVRWFEHWQKLLKKGSLLFESQHRTKSGDIFPVEIRANLYQIDSKPFNLALARDIRERKRIEQAHIESEERYRKIVETAFEGIMIHENGIILDANPQFAHLFGYENPEELIGINGPNTLLEPDSSELVMATRTGTSSLKPVEVIGRRKDGTTFFGETQAKGTTIKGKQAKVVVMRDISERKLIETREKEQALQAKILGDLSQSLIETTHDFSRTADLSVKLCAELIGDGASIFWYFPESQYLKLISVFNPDPELTDYFREHMTKYPISVNEGAYGQVIRNNQPILMPHIDMEKVKAGNISEDRRQYYEKLPVYSLMLAPLRQEDKCIGIIGLGRHDSKHVHYTEPDLMFLQKIADQISIGLLNAQLYQELQKELSERIRAENEVRLLNTELEKRVEERTSQLDGAMHELEAFSFSVSHDLRAPVRTISSFSQILHQDFGGQFNTESKDYLDRIIRAADSMHEKIDALLKLSRLIRVDIHPEILDLSEMVETQVAVMRATDPERKAIIFIAPGVKVQADRGLMQVVVDNLIDNAWKYTSKKPETYIEFGMTELSGNKTFYVKDNGAGFDMTYVGKLFGTFERLHNINDFPGHGIGLATVKRVIQRHGGKIWAEAEPEKGATFYFTLPEGTS